MTISIPLAILGTAAISFAVWALQEAVAARGGR